MAKPFDVLSNKIAGLVYSKTNGYKQELNIILEEFNRINFDSCHIDNPDKAVLLIHHLCHLVPSEDAVLAEKSCCLIRSLIREKGIRPRGKTRSFAFRWCLECLKRDVNITVLKCIGALIESDDDDKDEENGKDDQERLTEEISSALKKSKQSDAVTLMLLKCLRSLIPSEENKFVQSEKIALECLRIFDEYLYARRNTPDETNPRGSRCVISALKGLSSAVRVVRDPSDRADRLLGIAKGYMFYGLGDFEGIAKLYPSRITLPAEHSSGSKSNRKKLKGKYDRKSKKINVGAGGVPSSEENEETAESRDPLDPTGDPFLRTDDSDLSDSETDEKGKRKRLEANARLAALVLLATTAKKIGPKSFVCYLPAFLPDGLGDSSRTLIRCALEDPSPECRFEAVGILSSVISDSKPYFQLADKPRKSSFTSLASGIGHIILELHESLVEALGSEKSVRILTRLLKSASDLIRSTPYYKLEPGLITRLSTRSKPLLCHKDFNVRISAMNLFGCIVSIEPKIEEVKKIILNDADSEFPNGVKEEQEEGEEEEEVEEEEEKDVKKLWLFQTCLETVRDEKKNSNTAFVIESLQVLGALVQNFFAETLLRFPEDVMQVLDYCSKKSEYPVKLYSGKLAEIVLDSLQFRLVSEEEQERPSERLVREIWGRLLTGPVTKLIQSHGEPMLKCTGLDCLASMGVQINGQGATTVHNSFIFDLLERDKQILSITYLFASVKDEAPAVRSSALRALAVFVLFPSLREDSLFLLDAIDSAVSSSKDKHPNVRMQSAWLLGNISEAVVRNKGDSAAEVDDEYFAEEKILLPLLECSVRTASDAPKSRPGALRAIGNLLSVFDEKLTKRHKESVEKAVDVLIENAVKGSFMKARWNSCYALANVLRNYRIYSILSCATRILIRMKELVEGDKNFKVRIGAATVLASPPERRCYGDLYHSVWTAVFRALENSKNMTDYNEFQHRDHLIDQLCLVGCHLIGLMAKDDLSGLNVSDSFESFSHHMKTFRTRLVPEKSGAVLKAFDRITEFRNDPILKKNRTVVVLYEIFSDPDHDGM